MHRVLCKSAWYLIGSKKTFELVQRKVGRIFEAHEVAQSAGCTTALTMAASVNRLPKLDGQVAAPRRASLQKNRKQVVGSAPHSCRWRYLDHCSKADVRMLCDTNAGQLFLDEIRPNSRPKQTRPLIGQTFEEGSNEVGDLIQIGLE